MSAFASIAEYVAATEAEHLSAWTCPGCGACVGATAAVEVGHRCPLRANRWTAWQATTTDTRERS